jgi:HEAT repeat protein
LSYDVLPVIALALVAATVPFIGLLVTRRALMQWRINRTERLEEEVRPVATALVFGDGDFPESLRARELDALATVLGRYSRLLSGESRRAIASYFERSGGVDRACRELGSVRAWKRAAAAKRLGDVGSTLAELALIDRLHDRSDDVRHTAAESLARIGVASAVGPILEAVADGRIARPAASRALMSIGRPALPAILDAASSGDVETRRLAVELLARLGSSAEAPLLIDSLEDDSVDVRATASRGLGRLAAGGQVLVVREMLRDPEADVRAAAATGLATIGDRESAAALEAVAAHDSEFSPGRAAARALTLIDPKRVLAADERGEGQHLREAADRIRAGLA